ncbi:hypothetical protein LUZ60_005090 [Juncus effusus]|nr:hypothetical protein LUZ60_005090 [Juncus effusus]
MQRIKRQALTKLLQKCTNPTHLTQLHSLLLRLGLLTPTNSFFPALLTSTYTKLFSVPTALKLFYEIPKPSTFLYNSLLRAHSRSHQWKQCLNLLKAMKDENAKPDKFTLCIALKSCTGLSAFVQGKEIHALALKKELAMSDVFVGAALVELYSKCGDMFSALVYSSMIASYGMHGIIEKAMETFNNMINSSIKPNNITFVSLLSACSHAGLVQEGKQVYESMDLVYGVRPGPEHKVIVVDLLSRAGEVDEALLVVKHMNNGLINNPHALNTLLLGCTGYKEGNCRGYVN